MRKERVNVGQSQSKALCLPFYAILLAMGNPTVDYFSLDVEGAELPILKTIPWDKVDIKVAYQFLELTRHIPIKINKIRSISFCLIANNCCRFYLLRLIIQMERRLTLL